MFHMPTATALRLAFAILAVFACSARHESAQAQDRKPQPYKVTVLTDVSYMDEFVLDIYVPFGPGMFPTALTLHGVSDGKAAMEPVARSMAEQGWIVYNANWLAPERPIDAENLERSFEAAGCALRFAAGTASDHGADGKALTVIGLSAGGFAGALISLGSSEFGNACQAAGQDPAVKLFIGLEGAYLNAAVGRGGLAGAIREKPGLATRLDPRTYLDRETELEVMLFLGDRFQPAVAGTEMFYEALRSAGIRAEVRRTSGPHRAATFTQGVLELLRQ